MKKWYCACLTVAFLLIVTPLFAQQADLDDEDNILIVADMGSQDPPASPAATQGQQQSPAGMKDHQGWEKRAPGRWGGMAAYLGLSRDQIAKMRDVLGKPVSTLENPQASLLGAATLAAPPDGQRQIRTRL